MDHFSRLPIFYDRRRDERATILYARLASIALTRSHSHPDLARLPELLGLQAWLMGLATEQDDRGMRDAPSP